MTIDTSPTQLTEAAAKARAILAGRSPLGVVFSGGVDSATLLALAVAEFGADNVVAILGVSPSLASEWAGPRARDRQGDRHPGR